MSKSRHDTSAYYSRDLKPPAWMADGLCAKMADPDAWFPEHGGSAPEAVAACQHCPVKDLCRDYSVARPELEGIWAGLTKSERASLRDGTVRHCLWCGAEFLPPQRRSAHCSRSCSAKSAQRREAPPRKVAVCGTRAGYAAHHRRGEKACTECLDADRAYRHEYAKRIKQAERTAA